MPLIVTPRQLTQRSEIYRQLSQLTSAGISIVKSLEMLSKNTSTTSYKKSLADVATRLSQGETVADAWHYFGNWVPEFDIALVRAAESSGQLDSIFRMLADHYQGRARLMKQILSDMAYPVFVFHFTVLLFPLITFIQQGGMGIFILKTVGVLVPIYLVIFIILQASQSTRGAGWRAFMERVTKPVPLLGSGRHALALSRLAAALHALISAGVNIVEAWEMAAAASGSPALHSTVLGWKRQVMSGALPSEVVNQASNQFPEFFANIYHSGEVSGKLDESLKRISAYYLDEGTGKLHLLGIWLPKIFFMGLALMVGYKVISFYSGYFDQLNQIMK